MLRKLLPLAALAAMLAFVVPAQAQQASTRGRVVMQVSDNDPAKWNLALNNAKNIQTDLGAANVDIEIVAYGPGINMLKADSVVGNRVDEALGAGVKVVACENTMRNQKLASRTCCRRSTTSWRAWSSSCRSSSRAGRTSALSAVRLMDQGESAAHDRHRLRRSLPHRHRGPRHRARGARRRSRPTASASCSSFPTARARCRCRRCTRSSASILRSARRRSTS